MELNLYKVSAEYLAACDHLRSLDDLPEDVIQDTLEGLSSSFEEVALNVGAHIKNLDQEIAAMKAYEKDMHDRRKCVEKIRDQFRSYLLEYMFRCSVKKVKGIELSVSIRAAVARVVIDDLDSLPAQFCKIEVKRNPDKKLIKCSLMDGSDDVSTNLKLCAHLEYTPSLVIK